MKVLVTGFTGRRLMPTTPRKARKLLEAGKAMVICRKPFAIQLLYKTGGAVQDGEIGIDTGSQHIGIAVTSGNTVLEKTEVELRTSMEKKKLLAKRSELRRGRRFRKTRYRHPKYKPHTKHVYSEVAYKEKGKKNATHWHKVKREYTSSREKGWLPPSIQSKVDHHINWINRYRNLLPGSFGLRIEVARFDIAKLIDPKIRGEEYQHGRLYYEENKKAYVLAKFKYKCAICGHEFDKEHKPRLHLLTFRSKGATDNPDEYAPVCHQCHVPEEHKKGGILDKLRLACKRKEYREPTFMNILRVRMFRAFPDAEFTYGHITSADRQKLGLEKTHANDAVAVALHGNTDGAFKDADETVYYRQVRKKKRSLHEANPRKFPKSRKTGERKPNREAKRSLKNIKEAVCKGKTFCIWDSVLYNGKACWIQSFDGGSAYVVDFMGNYYRPPGKDYKQIPFGQLKPLHHNNNWIVCSAKENIYEKKNM